MTRKNLVIDRTFSNRFLRGATDRVALQYRSSKGFSTLEDVKREVASFSNAENFFYVQFRKTWYPVYLLAGAATIVVGKSFFCYGSSAEHKQPYLTYVEKKASNVPEVAHRELGGLSRIYPSICGNTISAALVSDLRTLDGNADLPVMCGSRISALTAVSDGRHQRLFCRQAFGGRHLGKRLQSVSSGDRCDGVFGKAPAHRGQQPFVQGLYAQRMGRRQRKRRLPRIGR